MRPNLYDSIEKIIAGRWISGQRIEDVIHDSKHFNSIGISTIINYLGEELTDSSAIANTINTYKKLMRYVKNYKLDAQLSIKPTQIGLSIDERTAMENYASLVNEARQSNIFIWLDMEAEATVSSTINMYMSQIQSGIVGICLQAYLKRTKDDILKIAKNGGVIRLVKGAYVASKNRAFSSWENTTKNYLKLLRLLYENSTTFTVATHDTDMIKASMELNKEFNRNVTYAMLKGIRNRLLAQMAKDGVKTSVYLPFGEQWVPYSYRRLKEAGHLKLIMRSFLERQGV